MFCSLISKVPVNKQLYFATFNNIFKLQQKCVFHKGSSQISEEKATEGQEQPLKKPKKPPVPKITLLSSQDDKITIATLEEAQHISKRRDLKLVKILDWDTKTQRPVYKLMSGAEYYEEELKQRQQRKQEQHSNALKGEKILTINAGISPHDLEVNIKKILKWLSKKLEVRITISGDPSNMERSENMYKSIEASLKDESRFLQKRVKGSDLKFQIIPPKSEDKGSSSL